MGHVTVVTRPSPGRNSRHGAFPQLNPPLAGRLFFAAAWLILVAPMPLPEKALIAQIRRMARTARQRQPGRARPTRAVLAGIGDDCAVLRLPPGHDSLVTTDFTLEGIHFRRDWHPAESGGHRCLARGLSDIAAMGGEPVAAFLSLALPRDLPQAWVRRFIRGLLSLAEKHGVELAGGDTAESPNGTLADIVVVGLAPKGKALLRSGARAGDRIFVSGELGGAAAAVLEMRSRLTRKKNSRKLKPKDYPRAFYPEPRVELGRILREKDLASAMIDLSDGLSTDLAHICEESGVGAEIESELIPCARVGKPAREVDLALALHGGEDYELLFTARPGKRIPAQIAGVALTEIGRITRKRKVLLMNPKGVGYELESHGWEHFRR
ncbi:MAG: thiamine-phosphate kinase [Terriglobales bacterium]